MLMNKLLACAWIGFLSFASPAVAQTAPPAPISLESVGSIDGGANPYLASVHIAALTPANTVLLYDAMEVVLLEFRFDGEYLGRIGQEGEGPGEYRRVDNVGFRGDTLWVYDMRLQRLSYYLHRELLRTEPVPGGGDPIRTNTTGLLANGRVLNSTVTMAQDSATVWLGGEEGLVDTLATVAFGAPAFVEADFEGALRRLPNVFKDRPLHVLAADGSGALIIERLRPTSSAPHSYRIILHREGETRSRTLSYTPSPLADYELDRFNSYVSAYAEQVGPRMGWTHAKFEDMFETAMDLPRFAVPVYDAELQSSGQIWLATQSDERGTTWVSFDPNLSKGRSFIAPSGERVYDIEGGRILTVWQDEWDVPHLNVYRLNSY